MIKGIFNQIFFSLGDRHQRDMVEWNILSCWARAGLAGENLAIFPGVEQGYATPILLLFTYRRLLYRYSHS